MEKVIPYLLIGFVTLSNFCFAATRNVPGTYKTIQAAINAASNGDTILIAEGNYKQKSIEISKSVTIASKYVNDKKKSHIDATVIDGGSGEYVFETKRGTGLIRFIGLTVKNSKKIINGHSEIEVDRCKFSGAIDQVSFERHGFGRVTNCSFRDSDDDGVDVDSAPAGKAYITIEDSTFTNCGDDGIEIRLFARSSSAPTMPYIIRDNIITGVDEDGIQFIDEVSSKNENSRNIRISNNLIVNSGEAGIGCMPNQDTIEDFGGAPGMKEPVYVTNNTIVENKVGITGGDNMVVLNCIIKNNSRTGIHRVGKQGIVDYTLFHNNGKRISSSSEGGNTFKDKNPEYNSDSYRLLPGSYSINKGVATYNHKGKEVLDLSSSSYKGSKPDLGAFESSADDKSDEPENPVANRAPEVDAGSDAAIVDPDNDISLNGDVRDDGLPNGKLALTWSKDSGPGSVSFTSPNSENTSATFSAVGTYVLKLTADDGALKSSDKVTINYNDKDEEDPQEEDPQEEGFPVTLRGPSTIGKSVTVKISVNKPANAVTAKIQLLDVFDGDYPDEGELYINENTPPIALFGAQVDADDSSTKAPTLELETDADDWVDGENVLRFKHTRTNGFRIQGAKVIFTSGSSNADPTARFTATPTGGKAPLNVSFDGRSSSDDGSIVSYSWNFGDGSSASGARESHTYTKNGEYIATLTVTDNNGATDSATRTISVANNEAPRITRFSVSPKTGNAPLIVDFDVTATDPDGSIKSYTWDFGDGEKSSGSQTSISHVYSSPDTYTASVAVTDNDGTTTSASETISVSVKPENNNDDGNDDPENVLHVPDSFRTIKAAINAAQNGDTILIEDGVYREDLINIDKAVTIASRYSLNKNKDHIKDTIIDGGSSSDDEFIFRTSKGVGVVEFIGLTIKGSEKILIANNEIDVDHCVFRDGVDQISFGKEGFGRISNCTFDSPKNDGVDSDSAPDDKDAFLEIAHSTFEDCGDGAIQIRLHQRSSSASVMPCTIRSNTIINTNDDGILLIDEKASQNDNSRIFFISNNLVVGSGKVGISCLPDENSREDFGGAPGMKEPVYVTNNTIAENRFGITGGDNMVVLNCIVKDNSRTGIHRVNKQGIVDFTLFHQNGRHISSSNEGTENFQDIDPEYSSSTYKLRSGSFSIDQGTDSYRHNGDKVLDLPDSAFNGSDPDLGAFESK